MIGIVEAHSVPVRGAPSRRSTALSARHLHPRSMTADASSVPPDARPVADIHELLALAELVGVRHYEVAGRRSLEAEDRPESIEAAEQDAVLSVRRHEDELEIRFRMVVVTPDADLVADVSVVYALLSHFDVSRPLTEEFVERVAVMAAFPFLRGSIFTTATRLGATAPVLGLLRAGQFRVGPAPDGEEPVSYTHLRAHETRHDLVCRLLL